MGLRLGFKNTFISEGDQCHRGNLLNNLNMRSKTGQTWVEQCQDLKERLVLCCLRDKRESVDRELKGHW